jgi:lipid-binding SYLF domain-containing protein
LLKTLVLSALTIGMLCAQEDTPDRRLRTSTEILHEILSAPDKSIPRDLLEKAACIIVVPGLKKGALLVGGEYGRGYALCRKGPSWSGPAAVKFGGGSVGAQIGGESTDVIMLVMNRRGMSKLNEDKFTLGGDASATAGPVGRTATAETDLQLHAEILSYSRTRGLFAGLALDGTVVSKDSSEDRKLYGSPVNTKAILDGDVPPPPSARAIVTELDRYPRTK